MAHVSLYRKYRPQTFTEILGQEHVARTLSNAITEGRVSHAYLFTGPRGTGKTSTARILAKALNCAKGPTPEPCGECESCVAIAEGSSLDVFELDAASHSGVDETREILSGVPLATAGGRKKVYVIDEVHMLTTQSFNALLKTLEEPPDHVVFVLATTEAHKVLPTIVSRTQRFDFRRASSEVIEDHLADIAKRESIDIEPDALGVIARNAEGSFRDALAALEQLASLEERASVEDAERLLGQRDEDALFEMFDAIAGGDVGALFTTMHSVVAQGVDVRQMALGAMEHARSLLLLRTAPDADELIDLGAEDRARLSVQAESFAPGSLVRILDLIGKALTEMRNAPNHRLLLKVALVRAAAPETDPSASGLLGRIERLERRMGIEGSAPPPAADVVASRRDTEPRSHEGAAPAKPRRGPTASVPPRSTSPSAAPQPTTPSPKVEGNAAAVGLGDIRDAWDVTLSELDKRSRRVGALMKQSRPISYDGSVLQVEVQAKFHRDEMTDSANSQLFVDALHAALGIRPDTRFVARGAEPEAPEPAPDLSEAADAAPIAEEDAVELVKRGLKAEIVEERSS